MQSPQHIRQMTGSARSGQPSVNVARLTAALLLAGCSNTLNAAAFAQAQAPAQQQATSSPVDIIHQHERELEAARTQQKRAAELREKLKAEIAAIGQDRSKLTQQIIDVAARVRGVETSIDNAEDRLRPLDAREQMIRESLDSRRTEVIEVLSALQRAGRRAPPALLVRPEDALNSLRTAMLLGAVVPEMRARAAKLVEDLTELVALRKAINVERDKLAGDRDSLRDEQTRLASLVDERQKKQKTVEENMEAEAARALALSKQVDSLQGLIAKMEADVKSAAKAAAAAAAVPPPAPPSARKNPARMTPAIAFASARGMLPLPVNGVKLSNYGGTDGAGGIAKGISLASRPGSQVTTPCDGWVVYAGPFRTYGQLLILNAGGGYHVLIAGMERISVSIGQFVLTGEPVATMGSSSRVASVLSASVSQPVLYIEFRKDGTPIDPGPWWAANEGEKVRG